MLHRSSLPVFDNVATMIADLGYLMFLVRSTEVWGVESKVSGQFNLERYEQLQGPIQPLFNLIQSLFDPIRSLFDPIYSIPM